MNFGFLPILVVNRGNFLLLLLLWRLATLFSSGLHHSDDELLSVPILTFWGKEIEVGL
jgi:hypothetical protein